jgi:starch-binding outer membrane protein, SusD/RagB family
MKKILLISVVFLATGCSKSFLDRVSPVQLSEESFWLSEKDATLGINGIYDVLQDRILYSGSLNGTAGLPMYDGFGDNAFNSYQYEGPGFFMSANIDPSYYFFKDFWAALYKGIGRANIAIEKITNMPASAISDASRKNLIAQAQFLRALFYSHLAVYFQDAPLILKFQKVEESYVPKNTYQEIMTQVVKDLKDAADVLPVSYPAAQYGYATKGAALGLLARVSLYNKDYQTVLDATATIQTLGYVLNANYAPLFTESGENSKEIIFAARFLTSNVSDNTELFSATFTGVPKVDQQPMPNLVKDYYCTDGKPITSSPLYNATTPKNNRDPRLSASIYFKNDVFITDINRVFTGNTATGYGQRKYIRSSGAVSSAGGQDFYILRYADILLMRAEALIELNQLTGVTALINQVRARVSMPSVETAEGAVQTQASLRAILRHERRVEFAFEGLRFFDLKRWGTVQEAFQRASADVIPGYNVTYRAEKSMIFPIPQSELVNNSSLVQNPVWQ